ncbi:MAG TPA: hypothetical protein VJZ72_03755 [Candidatus Limnocylindrales bacterium]|nr:hypothetical protein [Candidatus Limnocylindrales bacterium]
MTRALLVEHDPAVAERIAATLAMVGYAVDRCPGPTVACCPVLGGCGCTLVERADVLVYNVVDARFAAGDVRLSDELRSLYRDRALILLGPDSGRGAIDQPGGPGVVRLRNRADPERLALAIEDALADR